MSRTAILALALLGLALPASEALALDPLSRARLAAVDGDHATCARLADEARRTRDASWHAHHVYATCQAFHADARKGEFTGEEYAAEIDKAVEALRFLLVTPGLLIGQETRDSTQFVADELAKRAAAARAGQ